MAPVRRRGVDPRINLKSNELVHPEASVVLRRVAAELEPDLIRMVDRREVYALREKTIPLLKLDEFLHLARDEKPYRYVVVAGLPERQFGILVDGLLGQQEVVIKPVGESLKKVEGIAGATDLGDNRAVLVLDVGSMITHSFDIISRREPEQET